MNGPPTRVGSGHGTPVLPASVLSWRLSERRRCTPGVPCDPPSRFGSDKRPITVGGSRFRRRSVYGTRRGLHAVAGTQGRICTGVPSAVQQDPEQE
ncbi:hypothetical protein E2562_015395 [Oryza meyeriana var. granulata]|uniref:Uncharacterized protein n=1 Tax=Oryza meyeriana var. granulata TaxID=110450 RepID=A0A6G1EL20_9ORYZ|nr:hypothetical protein E2562_015395 [Oryza meyeriana var. granulata]